jgi:hypothetical protein
MKCKCCNSEVENITQGVHAEGYSGPCCDDCAKLARTCGDGGTYKLPLRLDDATDDQSCDNCANQEGRHYCLLHGQTIRNMDKYRCKDWSERGGSDSPNAGAVPRRGSDVGTSPLLGGS